MQFWNFLAIRLIQAFFVVFIVVSIVFFISRTVGSPETFLLPFDATNADIEALRENLGLNDPMIIQYGNFLWELLQLDFGNSFRGGGISTIESIGDRSVNTFKLGGAALVVAIGGSVPLGIIAALRRGKPVDWLARLLAVIGQATPSFWLGLMMIFFFAVELGWFPHRRRIGVQGTDPAGHLAGLARDGRHHAAHPLGHDRGDGHRLHPHRARQGPE